ncbi:MAG: hypothetical protein R3231_06640 [bacterium]|nr:hypothetical protein [bacterium]
MFDKIKKTMDEAYQGLKSGASKITLLTEEKTKVTKMQMKINSLQKDMDKVLARLGNRFYTLREEHAGNTIYDDEIIAEILKDADNFHGQVAELEEEINRIKEEYENRVKLAEEAGETQEEGEGQEAGDDEETKQAM